MLYQTRFGHICDTIDYDALDMVYSMTCVGSSQTLDILACILVLRNFVLA